MLADSRVSAVLPVADLERARKFYEEKLGLQAGDAPGGVMFECGHGEAGSLSKGLTNQS